MKLSTHTTYDFTVDPVYTAPNSNVLIVVPHADGTWTLTHSDLGGGLDIVLTTSQAFALLADLASSLTKGGSQ